MIPSFVVDRGALGSSCRGRDLASVEPRPRSVSSLSVSLYHNMKVRYIAMPNTDILRLGPKQCAERIYDRLSVSYETTRPGSSRFTTLSRAFPQSRVEHARRYPKRDRRARSGSVGRDGITSLS